MDEQKASDRKPGSWTWTLRLIPAYAIYDGIYRKGYRLWEAVFIGLFLWGVIEGILWMFRAIRRKSQLPPN